MEAEGDGGRRRWKLKEMEVEGRWEAEGINSETEKCDS